MWKTFYLTTASAEIKTLAHAQWITFSNLGRKYEKLEQPETPKYLQNGFAV